uniref:Uncharacterized protein n=1 Tax=Clandestinovirus TaxID=2831644 RepID=A0A8F8KQE8_9VIRU|nr:hypothetical protein KOM_12_19 [Clandestinovirus]
MLTNLIVSSSNLLGLPALLACKNNSDRGMVAFTMIASILMHLSETKHALPGIHPFNLYAWHFLQLDRIMAVAAMYYFCSHLQHVSTYLIIIAFIGLLSMYLSEKIENGTVWFATFHCIWHLVAYHLMYLIVSQ